MFEGLKLPDKRRCPCGRTYSVSEEKAKLTEAAGNVTITMVLVARADDPRAANEDEPTFVITCCSPTCMPLAMRELAKLTEQSLAVGRASAGKAKGGVH